MIFETFDQSDDETWPDQQKENDKDKYNEKEKDNHNEEHPQRTILETCDIWDTDIISDNWEQKLNIHSDPWIKSDRDSIRNSCNVFWVKFIWQWFL